MRQRAAWWLAVPILVVGEMAGHSLAYRIVAPDAARRALLLERTGHAYLADLHPLVGVCLLLAAAAVVRRSVASFRGRSARRVPSWRFALMPALATARPARLFPRSPRRLDRSRSTWEGGRVSRHGLGAALLAVAAAAALCAGLARADGDPASDTLVFTNAYLPAHAPSKANAHALLAQIAAAYSAGYRVKVAVIAARYDLGAVPSLFGKPATYARFLGEELAGVYVGPLLIVMHSGYGIYDGGRSTASESAVLATLAKPATTKPDDLTSAATAAVGELLRRGALRSRDILPPYVETVRAAAVGTQLKVLYYLSDDSGKASAKLEILRGGEQLFAAQEPVHPTSISRPESTTVTVPSSVSIAHTRLCIVATDASGNVGRACRPITVKR